MFEIVSEGDEAGELYLVGNLDYEDATEYIFEVCATNPTAPTSANPTATQTVTVSVSDVNDNFPYCPPCPFSTSVAENAGTGSS